MPDIDFVDRKLSILIVDDHTSTRELVKTILRSSGFINIFQAENGNDALRVAQGRTIDMIICDWNMPHCTGLDFLKMVREDLVLANIPFLMLTAEAYKENVTAAMSAGVSDYIVKPFTTEVLLAKVGKIGKKLSEQQSKP